MNELANPVEMRPSPNLCLHCGASPVDRADVLSVATPIATPSWTPLPHGRLIETVEEALSASRLTVGSVAHSLTHDGARYFGLMEIVRDAETGDYCWVLGLRNSHDKTFPAGVTAGAQVFVCDNLSFTGEVKLARKHTRFIGRDLPLLVERAIGLLLNRWHDQSVRFSSYKESAITDGSAHDLIVRAVDVGICSNRMIPDILKWWRKPAHEEFRARSIWSLFNSFTEALKQGNLAELPKRTEALHGLLDSHVGLAVPQLPG
jgi:hypothetical protein